jgi:hypothetical protein
MQCVDENSEIHIAAQAVAEFKRGLDEPGFNGGNADDMGRTYKGVGKAEFGAKVFGWDRQGNNLTEAQVVLRERQQPRQRKILASRRAH